MAAGSVEMLALGNPALTEAWEERSKRSHAEPSGARFGGDSVI